MIICKFKINTNEKMVPKTGFEPTQAYLHKSLNAEIRTFKDKKG